MVFVNLFVRKQTGRGGRLSNDSSHGLISKGAGLNRRVTSCHH